MFRISNCSNLYDFYTLFNLSFCLSYIRYRIFTYAVDYDVNRLCKRINNTDGNRPYTRHNKC